MDNFDLKKFLMESKALQNLNPILSEANNSHDEETIRKRIREIIISELGGEDPYDFLAEDDLMQEAKKKDEEENVEEEDVEVEDAEFGDMPDEDMPTGDDSSIAGLEDVAADMGGDESELMGHLMSALKMAKGMNNEKLETQIGNTLKFFVSEYIGGGQK